MVVRQSHFFYPYLSTSSLKSFAADKMAITKSPTPQHMPSCFKLLDKQTGEATSLSAIDDSICTEVLNVPTHDRLYGGGFFNWFDTIGFQIATGKPLGSQELRDHYLKSDLWADEAPLISKILDYLEARYTSHSFYGR